MDGMDRILLRVSPSLFGYIFPGLVDPVSRVSMNEPGVKRRSLHVSPEVVQKG